ncbi:MAG TPA: carbohydrate kinase [Methylophilaceae bacterium]|jgi:fructokinase
MTHQAKSPHTVTLFGEVLADVFPDRSVLGGAPFNVARHLQAFGLHPVMVSRTGNDALRDELLREMDRLGMDTVGMQCDPTHPTGQVRVHMENGSHRFEILPEQAYDHIHADVAHILARSLQPSMAYFGTLAQRNLNSRLALRGFLAACDCPRFLDINLREPWYDRHVIRHSLQRADIVKMNHEELETVARICAIDSPDPEHKARSLIERYGLELMIITCGPDGAWLITREQERLDTGPVKLQQPIVDTVGAGDAFAALCIIGLLHRWELPLILERANRFAAAMCTVQGGAPQDPGFHHSFRQEWGL